MTPRKIILLLFVVLLGVMGYSFFQSQRRKDNTQNNLQTSTPLTEEVPTGTFVDTLFGQFVYYHKGAFYEVKFPSRQAVQLAGVDEKIVDTFPAVRPTWSGDGKQFAFVVNDASIVVVDYKTGEQVSKITLDPKVDLSKHVDISFSPKGDFLLVKQEKEDRTHIRFYQIPSAKLITEQHSCTYHGVWLRETSAYVSTCDREGKPTIVLITPEFSDQLISAVGPSQTYTFLNQFDTNSLLVKKGDSVGKLTLAGQFSLLDPKQFTRLADVDAFVDLHKALATKIEQEKKTEKIEDLVVSSNNAFALFKTSKGLWVIDIPITSDPFFLFEGELPSIRPI